MLPDEHLRTGNLEESLRDLQDAVRKDPSNSKYRVFLFQLLSVLGQWERALTQLQVLGEMDAGTLAMVQTYREALRCEALRAEVFDGQRSPLVFGEPEQWVALVMEALKLLSTGRAAEALPLRERAFEEAPATPGTIDGQRFEWVADADSRLGPVLEAIVNGRYYWIPFQRIREIRVEEPADLRDVAWMPAHFVWANGGDTVGLIPTRYPGSESSEDSQIRMARKTVWVEQEGGVCLGLGQRTIVTDAGEYPLMDVRVIQLDTGEEGEGGAEAQNADE